MRGHLEAHFLSSFPSIAGVDEVGRGCLAGPVYAAAVILDYTALGRCSPEQLQYVRDSKTLSSQQRQQILPLIKEISLASALGHAEVSEIENLGIVPATFLAMTRALAGLTQRVDLLLIDGKAPLPGFSGEQRAIVKGDNLCYCIAAASIIAKEARDGYMRTAEEIYPGYGFAQHVGYGTQRHRDAIDRQGICALHRRNFAPIRQLVSGAL